MKKPWAIIKKLIQNIRYLLLLVVFSASAVILPHTLMGQQSKKPKTRILFVLDASQSMLGQWQAGQKIKIATKLLNEMVDSLKPIDNVEVALRVYGHQSSLSGKRNCKDTKLEVPFSKNNHGKIKSKLDNLYPKGTTPIAYSLEQAANDFPDCNNCLNTIILITDGIEECEGDPCAVSLALQRKGVALKPFVIGMGLDDMTIDVLECMGDLFNSQSKESFREILNIVISQALNNTTVQVNLMDDFGKPTETNVNMTFYDNFSGQIKYNYIHTMNHYGRPDTLSIDPLGVYNLMVHTLPPVKKDSITFNPGKHNIVAVNAPQGILNLKVQEPNEYENLKCIVRKDGGHKTLFVQDFNKEQRYITGKYDLEVLSIPRVYIEDVEISQSHTTKVEIPPPGLVTIKIPAKGKLSLFVERNNKLEWVRDLKEKSTWQSHLLQPGNYRLIYRNTNVHQSIYTKERKFEVSSGSSNQIKF